MLRLTPLDDYGNAVLRLQSDCREELEFESARQHAPQFALARQQALAEQARSDAHSHALDEVLMARYQHVLE